MAPERTPARSRPLMVICRCKSHCTTFNPTTGLYEGEGHPQARSTRDNHSRDDRAMISATALSQLADVPVGPTRPPLIQQAYDEIATLMSFPLSHPNRPLVFINLPRDHGPFVWPNTDNTNGIHLYALNGRHSSNRHFLSVANRLQELFSLATLNGGQDNANSPWDDLIDYIAQNMNTLMRLKEVEWSQQRGDAGLDIPFVNTEIHFQSYPPLSRTHKVALLTSLVMENMFFMPRRALRILLGSTKSLLIAAGASETDIMLSPKDPRAGPYRARLDPITRQYVVCPRCHHLYPSNNPRNAICVKRRTPGSPECNTPLWKDKRLANGKPWTVPIRTYLHQDLKSWIGRLLSREGMEQLLRSPTPSTGPVHDIWSSKVFQSLKDITGEAFFPAPPQQLRLVFSLSVDSFNPFHMKTAKQVISSTGIWMVLLNLPQHLRYLQENMYVAGVIAGPDKPSKEDIYPYLELVMKDLLEFWYTGVRYSRTAEQLLGTVVKAMLVPLICDMLAARQVVGLSSATSHHFCTFCDLDIDDVDVCDREEWPIKKAEHIRQIAFQWRDALNEAERDAIFKGFGIKWSPLHLLPYWDPIQYTVIDPMHALDLNLFQNHCRYLFRIDTKYNGGDGLSISLPSTEKPLSADNLRRLKLCVNLIRANQTNLILDLLRHPRVVLYTICVDNNIVGEGHNIVVGTPWILAQNIQIWRTNQNYRDVVIREPIQDIIDSNNEEDHGGSQPSSTETGPDRRVVTRLLQNLLNTDESAARDRAFNQGSSAMFLHICRLAQIETNDIDLGRRNAKRQLFDKIIENIDDGQETLQELWHSLLSNTTNQIGSNSRNVLGKDIMETVWEDMRNTILPSWITPAPPNWGTAQRGKLSADNWKVICTIHLPITLIRLWHDKSDRKKLMLDHFMDLVSAVQVANMRITSELQIQAYNTHMHRYISGIKTLFPDESLKPVHHAALHIGDMLGLFGPNHSHSGSHYERYINFFHRINTNSKTGELEQTLLKTSARSANLRAMLADDNESRKLVCELISVIDKVELEDVRGFRRATILDPESPTFTSHSKPNLLPLSTSHHRKLCQHLGQNSQVDTAPVMAMFFNAVSRNGVCYGVCRGSTFKDSSVIFEDKTHPSGSIKGAGSVSEIFQYPYRESQGQQPSVDNTYLVVRVLEPVAGPDPFKRFPFGGYLCKTTEHEVVVSLKEITSHFALTKFGDVVHVLPLDRMILQFHTDVEDLDAAV